jgi:hypothetical protein
MLLSLKQQQSPLLKRQLAAARRLEDRFPSKTHRMPDEMQVRPRVKKRQVTVLKAAMVRKAVAAAKVKGGLVKLARTTGLPYGALWRAADRAGA